MYFIPDKTETTQAIQNKTAAIIINTSFLIRSPAISLNAREVGAMLILADRHHIASGNEETGLETYLLLSLHL